MVVCVRCVRIIEFVFFRISECVSPQSIGLLVAVDTHDKNFK